MRVVISEIPRTGVSLDESCAAAELDLEGQGVSFTQSVMMHADVQRNEGSVEINLEVESGISYICDRCLQNVQQPLVRHAHIVRPLKAEKEIDITQIAREEIILEYPVKRLCRPDCKGLCPVCGRNRNYLSCACARAGETSPFRGMWLQGDVGEKID